MKTSININSLKNINMEYKKENIKITKTYSNLNMGDFVGTLKARLGINRMNYKVSPGIYSIGSPQESSFVFVTGNYKMSFDALRKELKGIDAYILVLDTLGINVWCAAAKGTFGTKELINRIEKTKLSKLVNHRNLILPQLGAVGVCGYEIKKKIGFNVIFGPVRGEDIPKFLENGLIATPNMRKVRFDFMDRIILTPIEIKNAFIFSLNIFGVMFLMNLLKIGNFNYIDVISYLGAAFGGCFLVPALLPWIPGRAFSLKGWIIGLFWILLVIINFNFNNILKIISYIFIFPSITSYYGLNFTGSSTYTSFSGVEKEMKIDLPIIIISLIIGIILLILGNYVII